MATNPSVPKNSRRNRRRCRKGSASSISFSRPAALSPIFGGAPVGGRRFLSLRPFLCCFLMSSTGRSAFPKWWRIRSGWNPNRPIILTARRPISVTESWRSGSRLPKIVSYAVPVTRILYAVFAGVLFTTFKFGTSADVKCKTLTASALFDPLSHPLQRSV